MNEGVRTAPAADGGVVILAAFCPTCATEVMPNVAGFCSWCGTRIVDENTLTARAAIAATNMKGAVGQMEDKCKIEGCQEPPLDKAGPYAKLCAGHKQERRDARASLTTPPARPSRSSRPEDGLQGVVRQLVPLARRVDTARAKLTAIPSTDGAKAAFDEAARRASQSPTPENLDRLQEATRELRAGAPKRSKLQEELSHAERAFKDQLTAVLEEARAA